MTTRLTEAELVAWSESAESYPEVTDDRVPRLIAEVRASWAERDEARRDANEAHGQMFRDADMRRSDLEMLDRYRAQLTAAEAALAAAREVLRRCEWVPPAEDIPEDVCPICDHTPSMGHTPTCALAAALGEGKVGV